MAGVKGGIRLRVWSQVVLGKVGVASGRSAGFSCSEGSVELQTAGLLLVAGGLLGWGSGVPNLEGLGAISLGTEA